MLRDVYYIAVEADPQRRGTEYSLYVPLPDVHRIMATPQLWEATPLFDSAAIRDL